MRLYIPRSEGIRRSAFYNGVGSSAFTPLMQQKVLLEPPLSFFFFYLLDVCWSASRWTVTGRNVPLFESDLSQYSARTLPAATLASWNAPVFCFRTESRGGAPRTPKWNGLMALRRFFFVFFLMDDPVSDGSAVPLPENAL